MHEEKINLSIIKGDVMNLEGNAAGLIESCVRLSNGGYYVTFYVDRDSSMPAPDDQKYALKKTTRAIKV